MTALRWSLSDVTGVVLRGSEQTARTFVALLRVCLHQVMLLVINAAWGRNLTLVCMYTLHRSSFVCWLYVMGVVLALDEQSVRLYCLNLTRTIGDRYSMRSQSHFHTLFEYIMYNNNGSTLIFIRWLNVWNGCRVGAGRSARTFVLLRVCLNWAILLVIDTVCMRL